MSAYGKLQCSMTGASKGPEWAESDNQNAPIRRSHATLHQANSGPLETLKLCYKYHDLRPDIHCDIRLPVMQRFMPQRSVPVRQHRWRQNILVARTKHRRS